MSQMDTGVELATGTSKVSHHTSAVQPPPDIKLAGRVIELRALIATQPFDAKPSVVIAAVNTGDQIQHGMPVRVECRSPRARPPRVHRPVDTD